MGRPFNTSTKLGKKMAELSWTAHDLSVAADVNVRRITEYLAGRATPPMDSLVRMARALGVEVWEIDE